MKEKKVNKLLAAVKSRKYEIIIFAALCMNLLLLLTKEELVSERFYGALTFDTHFGVYSLTLVGSIIKLLFGSHPSLGNTVLFQFCALIFGYALTALFLGGAIRRADERHRTFLCCFAVFISVIHIGFSDFAELFDLFDIYWLIGVVLALFLAEKEITRFFVPLLAVTSMWVHFGFLMTYMPVIYIMCIYCFMKKKSKAGAVQLVLMVILTVAGAYWFFVGGRKAGLEYSDVSAYIFSKTGKGLKDSVNYVWQHFTDMSDMKYYDMEPFYAFVHYRYNPLTMALGYLYITFKAIPLTKILVYILLYVPFGVFFGTLWKNSACNCEKRENKFVFFLCAVSPLVNLAGMITSSDSSRMCAHLIISQTLLLFMFVRDGNQSVQNAVEKARAFISSRLPLAALLAVFYLSLIFAW